MKKYGEYEQVNGATLNAANERIERLEYMLSIIWNHWQCDECPENELLEELMSEIEKPNPKTGL